MNQQQPKNAQTSQKHSVRLWCAIALWVGAVAVSWGYVTNYEFATNDPATAELVSHWPADASLQRSDDRSTLVMFIHPKCPCTRATMTELERMLTSIGHEAANRFAVVIVATIPPDSDALWMETDTVQRSSRLPNAEVIVDPGGTMASKFHATTSGTIMLFDSAGRRQYGGGITMSRGHEGANVGGAALKRLLLGDIGAAESIPAFGCRLCLPSDVQKSAVESRNDIEAAIDVKHTTEAT